MIDLSVVVCAFDMRRELPRTVRSLSPPYQTGIAPERMEIIVVDNGSAEPVDRDWFDDVAAELRIVRFPPGNPSPCAALNAGVAAARGDAFVLTMGFHLGHETQQVSIAKGGSRTCVDRCSSADARPAPRSASCRESRV